MWLMLQHDAPENFVVATGETHSVRDFLDIAFNHAGLDWSRYVKQDTRFLRPAEVDQIMLQTRLNRLDYRIEDEQGQVVEQHDVPLGFVYGSDTELIGGMDKAVLGKRVGDQVEVGSIVLRVETLDDPGISEISIELPPTDFNAPFIEWEVADHD